MSAALPLPFSSSRPVPLAWSQHVDLPWTGYRWLVPAANLSSPQFLTGKDGTLRVTDSGVVWGEVTLQWSGRAPSSLKHVLVGESAWEPGALPPASTCLSDDHVSEGACVDGFSLADGCACEAGEAVLPFTRVVEAGSRVQVAALPLEYGPDVVARLSVYFRPGGWCEFLGGESPAQCATAWDGMRLGGGGGCAVELARQSLDGTVELSSGGCDAPPSGGGAAPFLWREVPRGPFAATVRVLQCSDVQWSAAGLLATAAEARPRPQPAGALAAKRTAEWAALLSAQSRATTLQAAPAGNLSAWWRASAAQAWQQLGPSVGSAGLAGPLRVGLTQHTSSHNFGFALMDSFSLEVGAAAADSLPSVSGGGEGGGGGGGVCCSPLAGGGEGAGSTARWLPLLLLLPALAAALLGSRSDSWREGGAEAGAGDGSTKGKGSLEYGARERAAQSRGWAGVGAWRAATAQRVAPGGDELAEGGDEAAEDDGAAWRDSWYSALGYSRLPDEAEGRGGAGGSAAGSPTDSAPSSTPSDWSREVGVGRFASFEATAGASFAEIALQGGPSQRLPAADGPFLARLAAACGASRRRGVPTGDSEPSVAFVATSSGDRVDIRLP
ncbi:hypothetical protein EMIHUDRAFT_449488 [Emiliania huxleyi CCMP1516]|uniref:Uncharacterized protein n=2 Tax=Emiliania huxleyi TaxID=2903 RepID=A0A0D3K8G2_EMIH1|nr:hypothetical protein EMIHUDRAFT_449488 [Emiliania huxleyi CCMP1516]EOD32047.1 hypothetical protein EMIHUDRAFT_449488 [Emiliania huxleyi CCMP1516]|eukprot:XP_005784476.1 hypothetical protein EMIHUDRAFT_449488 [Emiliania huxleyi CCMP1516]